MKNQILGLVLLQLTWLTGCVTMKPALDSGKIYEDSGSVMQKIGDNNCHLLIGTEHYGVFDTHTLPIEKCEKYRPGTKLQIRIYNAYGMQCAELVNEMQHSGNHKLDWNADNLPAGVYTCRIEYNGQGISNKLLLMK